MKQELNQELIERGYADLSKIRKPGSPWGWHAIGDDSEFIEGLWRNSLVESESEDMVIYTVEGEHARSVPEEL